MPRPKEFSPDEALAKAMEVFWAQGYEATTVQDLVDAMGINRFSLYDTFGDKRSLFLSALDRYGASIANESLSALEGAEDGMAAIRAFFLGQVERFSGEEGRRGCLMANCTAELAGRDDDAAERSRRALEGIQRAFRSALGRAQVAGDIGPDRDLDDSHGSWSRPRTACPWSARHGPDDRFSRAPRAWFSRCSIERHEPASRFFFDAITKRSF